MNGNDGASNSSANRIDNAPNPEAGAADDQVEAEIVNVKSRGRCCGLKRAKCGKLAIDTLINILCKKEI